MKKLIFFASILGALFLTGCSSDSPDAVAKNFLNAYLSGDIAEAKKFADKKTVEMLVTMEGIQMGKKPEKKEVSVEILETKMQSDTVAMVSYKAMVDGKEKKADLKVRKEDGKWKAHQEKEKAPKESSPSQSLSPNPAPDQPKQDSAK